MASYQISTSLNNKRKLCVGSSFGDCLLSPVKSVFFFAMPYLHLFCSCYLYTCVYAWMIPALGNSCYWLRIIYAFSHKHVFVLCFLLDYTLLSPLHFVLALLSFRRVGSETPMVLIITTIVIMMVCVTRIITFSASLN